MSFRDIQPLPDYREPVDGTAWEGHPPAADASGKSRTNRTSCGGEATKAGELATRLDVPGRSPIARR